MIDAPLLTVQETAERLRVSPRTVYDLVGHGLLVSLRVGIGRGTIRIAPQDLANYLEHARDGKPEPLRRLRRA